MIFALYFASGFIVMGAIWLFVETQRLRRKIKAQLASPTKYRRANRDKPIPYVAPPWEREEGGVDYRFINLTGEER